MYAQCGKYSDPERTCYYVDNDNPGTDYLAEVVTALSLSYVD